MRGVEAWLLEYLLNGLWQVPLVFAAAWVSARAVRRTGAAFVHRVWVGALVLEAVLPACSVQPVTVWRAMESWAMHLAGGHALRGAQVTVTMGDGQTQGVVAMPTALLAAAALVYAGCVAFFAVRLGVGWWRTARLRSSAEAMGLHGEMARSVERYAALFGVDNVEVSVSREIAGPVTLGVCRRTLLLPGGFGPELRSEDLDASVAHEFAHIQRRDFAKNLLYEALSLAVAFHPALWLTRRRVAESREIVCDELAADAVQGRQRYAQSLLRLASQFAERTQPRTFHAIGIFDANHFGNFERRVMRLTEKRMELKGVRRTAMAAVALAIGVGASVSALAMRMQVATPVVASAQPMPMAMTVAVPKPATGEPAKSFKIEVQPVAVAAVSPATEPAPMRVKVLTPAVNGPVTTSEAATTPDAAQAAQPSMKVGAAVMAGNILVKVPPVYPQAAKDAHVSGSVVLHAVIAKDGTMKSLSVVSGPEELQMSAMEAVRQWTYRPYLLNGEPTEVDTTITVNYNMNGY